MNIRAVPILGFAAWSGTGKTTLLRSLLPKLRARGLRIGVAKHAHHDFDIDIPGKDSYELRRAGASHVLVGSRKRWALVVEAEANAEPPLAEMLAGMSGGELDLILIEGLKGAAIPKIELHRPGLGKALLYANDTSIVAIATDAPIYPAPGIPVLDINDPDEIAEFIVGHLGLHNAGNQPSNKMQR